MGRVDTESEWVPQRTHDKFTSLLVCAAAPKMDKRCSVSGLLSLCVDIGDSHDTGDHIQKLDESSNRREVRFLIKADRYARMSFSTSTYPQASLSNLKWIPQ